MDPSGSCLAAIVLYLVEGTSVKVKIRYLEQKLGFQRDDRHCIFLTPTFSLQTEMNHFILSPQENCL